MTRRRAFLAALGGALPAAAYSFGLEPQWLELTRTTIRCSVPLRTPLRILHVADLHASFCVSLSYIEQAIAFGVAQAPDLICVTGDFITFQYDFDRDRYVGILRRLAQAAPAYAVVGNHDGGKWAPSQGGYPDHKMVDDMLAESGIRLLHNRSAMLRVRSQDLALAGVGDLWSEEIDGPAAFRHIPAGVPTVLLSHNPDSKTALAAFDWHVMLCGHTHGGQVLIPLVGPGFAPVNDKRFIAGLRGWRGRQIYVTRGVGNIAGVRFRCRPEIGIVTLI